MRKKQSKRSRKEFLELYKAFKESKGVKLSTPVFTTNKALFGPLHHTLIAKGWWYNEDALIEESSEFCSKMPFYDFKFTSRLMDINIWGVFPEQVLNHVVGCQSFSKKKGLASYARGVVWLDSGEIEKGFKRGKKRVKGVVKEVSGGEGEALGGQGGAQIRNGAPEWLREIYDQILAERAEGGGIDLEVDRFFPRCYDFQNRDDFKSFVIDFYVQELSSAYLRFLEKIVDLEPDEGGFEGRLGELLISLGGCEANVGLVFGILDFMFKVLDSYTNSMNGLLGLDKRLIDPNDINYVLKMLSRVTNSQEELKIEEFENLPNQLKIHLQAIQTTSETSNTPKDSSRALKTLFHRQTNPYFTKAKNPQICINKQNTWIVKPSGLSRGRGIHLSSSLPDILHYTLSSDYPFVCQKYIENALLLKKRRFDIRQWVIVSSFAPLEVFLYDEFYVRLCSSDYDETDLGNNYKHLANNSIGKYNLDSGDEVMEDVNMMSMARFGEYLNQIYGYREIDGAESGQNLEKFEFLKKIVKQIQNQVVLILKATGGQTVSNRKNSFVSLGFDFMVDENLSVYLIEVNVSPAMDKSSGVTGRLVQEYQRDVAEMVAGDENGKGRCFGGVLLTDLLVREFGEDWVGGEGVRALRGKKRRLEVGDAVGKLRLVYREGGGVGGGDGGRKRGRMINPAFGKK